MKVNKSDVPGVILFLLPGLILFAVFFLVPIGSVVYRSFFDWDGINAPVFNGVENYLKLFANSVFWRSLTNNVIWAFAACFIQVPLALLMAIILSQKPKGWKFFRTVYFLPQVISGIAIASLWSAVYNSEFGLLNGFLRAVGLGEYARNWLGDPKTALICVLGYGLLYVGYYMVIIMAGITSIDECYYEAAEIDGASSLQKSWHITIPLIRHSILTCITLAAVFGLRTFEQVYLLTNGSPANRTSVLVLFMYNQMRDNNYGGANASSAMLILVGALVIMVIRLFFGLTDKDRPRKEGK